MAQCPSCGAGLTKKEIHKTVHEANPQPISHSTIMLTGEDSYQADVSKDIIEITYECMFCGNVYEEWELKQKKETLEMNGIESDMMEFLIGDK